VSDLTVGDLQAALTAMLVDGLVRRSIQATASFAAFEKTFGAVDHVQRIAFNQLRLEMDNGQLFVLTISEQRGNAHE
jgi:hypothetical protein